VSRIRRWTLFVARVGILVTVLLTLVLLALQLGA
jgi:hypothetical protein